MHAVLDLRLEELTDAQSPTDRHDFSSDVCTELGCRGKSNSRDAMIVNRCCADLDGDGFCVHAQSNPREVSWISSVGRPNKRFGGVRPVARPAPSTESAMARRAGGGNAKPPKSMSA